LEYLILILILYLFTLNIITTIRLIKSAEPESFQKIFQILIVWLLPILGVFLVSHFLNDNPIIVKNNNLKYFLLKLLCLPFLIKIAKTQKSKSIDISSSNLYTSTDIFYGDIGGGYSSGGGGD